MGIELAARHNTMSSSILVDCLACLLCETPAENRVRRVVRRFVATPWSLNCSRTYFVSTFYIEMTTCKGFDNFTCKNTIYLIGSKHPPYIWLIQTDKKARRVYEGMSPFIFFKFFLFGFFWFFWFRLFKCMAHLFFSPFSMGIPNRTRDTYNQFDKIPQCSSHVKA